MTDRDAYLPHGAAREMWTCRDKEVLICGPAGTGKTRAVLEKAYCLAMKYPGARMLFVRKTRHSLSESALVTFERDVLPAGHPARTRASRSHRDSYTVGNGSSIVLGGLDYVDRLKSTDFDGICVFEATELVEDDWEVLTTRLGRGSGKVPFAQIVGDCNPGAPSHWLKRRCDGKKITLFNSRHEDNPVYWDSTREAWTEVGVEYLARLDRLSGHRFLRLRKGLWAAAEGLVYTDYDPVVHLINRFDIPSTWRRFRAIDFGYTHPICVQWWAQDPDGRLYRYRELYETGRLVEDVAKEILKLDGGVQMPTICDHDAEARATLKSHMDCDTIAARKDVRMGIQAVQARFRIAGDKRPRLFLLRDSLVRRDQRRLDARLPTCCEEEIESYVYSTATADARKEEPVKLHDDAMDTMRYAVMYADAADGQVDVPPPTVAGSRVSGIAVQGQSPRLELIEGLSAKDMPRVI